jgi:hypothetical protein
MIRESILISSIASADAAPDVHPGLLVEFTAISAPEML